MATRLIGTEDDNPILPPLVKVAGTQVNIADTAGDFTATTVEAALAEVVAALKAAELWHPTGGGGGTDVPPGTPTGVIALAGDGSATISWVAPVGAAVTSYVVERSTLPTSGWVTPVDGTLPGSQLLYLNAPLTNGTTYYFRVTAHNDVGNSVPSIVVAVVPETVHPTVPGAPTSFTAQAGPGTVTVNWLAPTSDGNSPVIAYTVQRAVSTPTTFTTVGTVNGTTYSYLDTGLTNGTVYYFRVFATNAVGDSTPTTTVSATPTTAATAPTVPQSVVATPGTANVTVTWVTPASDGGATITAYAIEGSILATTGFNVVGTIPAYGAPTTFTSTNLNTGTTYYFRVIAQNAAGSSPPSTIVNAVPLPIGTIPVAWQDAVDTGDLDIISGWYDANTGYDTDGHTLADLWGPGQTAAVTINDAWLTANAGAKVVLSGGRWTVTNLHASAINIGRDNVTLSHCYADRPSTQIGGGFGVLEGFVGIIIDHCTANGHFGQGLDSDWGDATGYNNFTVTNTPDLFTIRYSELTGYRAAMLFYNGCTAQYNWVHDLYIYGTSHNTACSIRWNYNTIYRNFLNDGTSSAMSFYADLTPYSPFTIEGNIFATHGHSFYEINFGQRPPDYYNLLQPGFERRLIDNYFDLGYAADLAYFTETNNNKLLTGEHIFMDEGAVPVANQPMLRKMRYLEYTGHPDQLTSYEFTPSPNSTLLVFAGIQNGAHSETQSPSVTCVGETPQVFSKIAETAFSNIWGGDNYGFKCWLYQGQTGAIVNFEHITVDPWPATFAESWMTFWIYEIPGRTNMTLAQSSVATNALGFPGNVDSITSGALVAPATTGRLCMAFSASVNGLPAGVHAPVSGWNQIGVQRTAVINDARNVMGAAYWRTNFTGTTMTVPDLGLGATQAGLILTEWT